MMNIITIKKVVIDLVTVPLMILAALNIVVVVVAIVIVIMIILVPESGLDSI
jgi:hypothetical protein